MWNSLWYTQGGGGTTGLVLLGEVALMEPIEVELVQTVLAVEIVPNIEVVLEEPITVEVD